MKTLLLTLLLGVASTSLATTYECTLTQPKPGAPTYLIVIKEGAPGLKGQAIVLSQTKSTGNVAWNLINGNAIVNRPPDAAPVGINASDDISKVDWSVRKSCFITAHNLHFRLMETTIGVTGSVYQGIYLARNPNLAPHACPEPHPAPPSQPEPITCQVL
jgi:hypothetical protein